MTRPSRLHSLRSPDFLAALAVTLAPLLYFLPATRGQLFISPDDGVIFNIPLRVAAARIVAEGSLPLWNPYVFSGMPLHGAAQAGLLFPLNWFFLFFDAPTATNLMMLSSYALAALGAYLFARRTGSGIAGSVVTSLVYQWSGFLVAQIGHTNIVQTAAMLPWVLWAVEGYGSTGDRRRGIILAALVALQVFAGHQQTLAYSLVLAAAYAVVMWRAVAQKRNWYLWSLVFLAAGLVLAAVQILPAYELMRNSLRARTSFDFFSSFSLPPRFLLTFLAPYVVGGGDGQLFRAPYVSEPFYGEYIGYAGLATLMLAALAFLLRRDARTKFWWAVAVVAVALALGRNWPFKLYGLVYYTPVLGLFRVPARHMMEVDFALAVLAGRGLTALAASESRALAARRALTVGACVVLLTLLAVTAGRPADFRLAREAPATFMRAPELFLPVALAALSAWALWRFAARGTRAAALILLAVLALDLCLWGQSSGWRVASPARESKLWRVPDEVKFIREQQTSEGSPFRVLTVPQAFDPDVPFSPTQPDDGRVLALQPDTYMMHGVENAAGYDGFGLARYSRLADDMKIWGDLSDPERSLRGPGREFDLLGVRYLLTRKPARAGVGTESLSSISAAPAAPASSSASPTAPPSASSVATQSIGGLLFAAEDLKAPPLDRGERLVFAVPRVEAERVALLTNLSWSTGVPDGTTVGTVRLRAEDGNTFDFELRAGTHTSEWAYDRADIRRAVRHKRAPVATSYAVEDASGRYDAHTYLASFALPRRAAINGVEITVAQLAGAPDLGLSVARASLIDEQRGQTVPLRAEWMSKASPSQAAPQPQTAQTKTSASSGGRWRRVAETEDVVIYENAHVVPRAWLATRAEVLGELAMLEVIRTGKLPDGSVWEPTRTALLESPLDSAPAGGEPGLLGGVKRDGPNRVRMRAVTDTPSILVLAENHYSGWRAYVDGRAVETLRVNYNLRGVLLPAGDHEVSFVYRPKSVIAGLLVSLIAAAALALWRFGLLPEEKARRIFERGRAR